MSAFTNYLRNKWLDHLLRATPFVAPSSVFLELVGTVPTASTNGTPLSGTGYTRKEIVSGLVNWSGTQGAGSTAVSSGTSGIISNNVEVDWGIAAAAWGTASYWEIWDSLVDGNRLLFGTIVNGVGDPSPRTIAAGDPVLFPAGSLKVQAI